MSAAGCGQRFLNMSQGRQHKCTKMKGKVSQSGAQERRRSGEGTWEKVTLWGEQSGLGGQAAQGCPAFLLLKLTAVRADIGVVWGSVHTS